MEGWSLIGDDTLECNSNGFWDFEIHRCEKISCSNEIEIKNGKFVERTSNNKDLWRDFKITNKKFHFKDKLDYVCENEEFNNSINSIECLSSGLWSTQNIECFEDQNIQADQVSSFKSSFDVEKQLRDLVTCPPITFNHVLYVLDNVLFSKESIKRNNLNIHGDTYHMKCPIGYMMEGNDTITCMESGVWSASVPQCHISLCPEPMFNYKIVSQKFYEAKFNAKIVQNQHSSKGYGRLPLENKTGLPFATVIKITCPSDYKVVDDRSTTVCLENGQWNEPSPVCEVSSCSELNIENGYSNHESIIVGSIIEIYCNEGFELIGERTLLCNKTGFWSHEAPLCVRKKCDWPAINNSYIKNENNQTNMFYMDSVRVECKIGFKLNGSSVLKCGEMNNWLPDHPFCQTIQCVLPFTNDSNLIFKNENNIEIMFSEKIDYNKIIKFSCKSGYKLIGHKSITCLHTGNLSTSTYPVCHKNQCNIWLINEIEGIKKINETLIEVGGKVKLSCQTGYVLTSNEYIKCLPNLKWSELPACEEIVCPIMNIKNGKIIGKNFTYRSSIEIECEKGYEIKSANKKFICELKGNWSPILENCQKIQCLSPPFIPNAQILERKYFFEDELKVLCDVGHHLIGPETITCLWNKKWSQPPMCEKVFCEKKIDIDKNLVFQIIKNQEEFERNGKLIYNAAVKFKCKLGFKLIGDDLLKCRADGTWNAEVPFCQQIFCQKPSISNFPTFLEIPSPNELSESFEVNSILKLKCKENFVQNNAISIKCLENGNWSQTSPNSCSAIICPKPVNQKNWSIKGNDFFYKSRIEYFCKKGYELVGNAVRECLSNSSWSGTEPSCQPIQCSIETIMVTNVKIQSIPPYFIGDTLKYACDDGYELIEKSSITCTEKKTWVGKLPVCKLKGCRLDTFPNISSMAGFETKNFKIHHSKDNKTYHEIGFEIEIKCKKGYYLIGNSYLICLKNLSWSEDLPRCERVICGNPPIISNSVVTQFKSKYFYNETYTYICEKGFEMKNKNDKIKLSSLNISCETSGFWSNVNASCERISCGKVPQIKNAEVDYFDTLYGSSAYYECNLGFKMYGFSKIECLENRSWSEPRPKCEQIHCGDLPFVNHSTFTMEGNKVGNKIKYQCDFGYRKVGNPVMICNENGEWRNENDFFPNVSIESLKLQDQSFGCVECSSISFSGSGALEFDDEDIETECGKNLLHDKTEICFENENTGSQKCLKTPCLFATLSNGEVKFSIDSEKQTVFAMYSCKKGFELHGRHKRACLLNGTWSHNEPICKGASILFKFNFS